MAKPEWGSKHTCSHCSAVFYDMKQNPILCPACGKTHEPETLLKARRGSRASAEAAAAKKAAEKPVKPKADEEKEDLDVEDGDDLVDMDDDDDTLIEDDDLDDDDDDDLRDVPAKSDSGDKDS
jgi:uncharacterized protein (TIGR02300 family)